MAGTNETLVSWRSVRTNYGIFMPSCALGFCLVGLCSTTLPETPQLVVLVVASIVALAVPARVRAERTEEHLVTVGLFRRRSILLDDIDHATFRFRRFGGYEPHLFVSTVDGGRIGVPAVAASTEPAVIRRLLDGIPVLFDPSERAAGPSRQTLPDD